MMTIGLIYCGANGAQKTGSNLLFLHSSINTSINTLALFIVIFCFSRGNSLPIAWPAASHLLLFPQMLSFKLCTDHVHVDGVVYWTMGSINI